MTKSDGSVRSGTADGVKWDSLYISVDQSIDQSMIECVFLMLHVSPVCHIFIIGVYLPHRTCIKYDICDYLSVILLLLKGTGDVK